MTGFIPLIQWYYIHRTLYIIYYVVKLNDYINENFGVDDFCKIGNQNRLSHPCLIVYIKVRVQKISRSLSVDMKWRDFCVRVQSSLSLSWLKLILCIMVKWGLSYSVQCERVFEYEYHNRPRVIRIKNYSTGSSVPETINSSYTHRDNNRIFWRCGGECTGDKLWVDEKQQLVVGG
jgi:hypothetical protein